MRTPNSRSCHSICCGDGLISVKLCARADVASNPNPSVAQMIRSTRLNSSANTKIFTPALWTPAALLDTTRAIYHTHSEAGNADCLQSAAECILAGDSGRL